MGIRFRCPNGHKIHVKAFLAGKRGICPVCGLKVPIPQVSDPEFADRPAKRRRAHPRTAAPPSSASRSAAQPAASAAGSPAIPPGPLGDADPAAADSIGTGPGVVQPPAPVPSMAESFGERPGADELPRIETQRRAGPAGGNDRIAVDPIAVAPQARWFVRPPSGGQFGPAPGVVLREWMAEGRVTPETYVWREGWPEWQRAAAVFGDFAPSAAAVPVVPEVAAESRPLSARQLYRQRKSNRTTLLVVTFLGLTCLLLLIALVYVVRFMD